MLLHRRASWTRRWRQALAPHAIWVTGALVAALCTGALLALALALRQDALTDARTRHQQLASSLAYPLAQAVTDVDAVLGQVAAAQAVSAAAASAAVSTAHAGPGSSWLRALAVVDRDGHVLASSDESDVGAVLGPEVFGRWPSGVETTLGPRVSARRLADLRLGETADSGPLGPGSAVVLRRATHADHGEVLVVGLLAVEGLVNRLHATSTDSELAVAVVDYQGTMLAASAVVHVEPRTLAPFVRYLPQFEAGHWQGDGLTGSGRIGAFQGTSLLPLAIWVESSIDVALVPWRRQAWHLGAVAVFVVLVLSAGVIALQRAKATPKRPPSATSGATGGPAPVTDAALEQALSGLPVGLFRTDVRGTLLQMTPHAASVLGQPAAPGGSALWAMQPPQSLAGVRRWYAALEASENASTAAWTGHAHLRSLDGAVHEHEIHLVPVSVDGKVNAVLGLIVESHPSSSDQLAAELESSRARTAIFEVLAREIRQPLQTILGWAELGHVRGDRAGATSDIYARILGASYRIQALVDDLTTEHGSAYIVASLVFRPIDLRAVVAQVFANLQPLAHVQGLDLRLVQPDAPLRAMIDAAAVQRALATLVTHAMDASRSDRTITISVQRNGTEEAMFTVGDGSGRRTAVHWAGLFARQGGHPQVIADLEDCRRVVAAHGGRLHALATEDQGLVRVILPLMASQAEVEDAAAIGR